MILRSVLIAALAAISVPAAAKDKVPNARDGVRDGYVQVGGVAYPAKLHGIAYDWERECFGKQRVSSCTKLARALATGAGTMAIDPIGAAGYYQQACKLGDGPSCAASLDLFRASELVNHSKPASVLQTARRGCEELGNADTCGHYGLMIYAGAGVARSEKAGYDLLTDNCKKGSLVACRFLADTLYADDRQQLQEAAIKLYRTLCNDQSAGWACGGLAQAQSEGRGTPVNTSSALEAATKGCLNVKDSSPLACSYYGASAVYGGDPEQAGQAARLLTSACLAGVGQACYQSGLAARKKPAGSKYGTWEVPLFFRDGCDLDVAESCFALAMEYSDGRSVPEDGNRVLALSQKACSLGSSRGCEQVAAFEEIGIAAEMRAEFSSIDPSLTTEEQLLRAVRAVRDSGGRDREAVMAVVRLSQEGNAEASFIFAEWMNNGLEPFIAQDRQNAMIAYENAASQGHEPAAIEIGMAYWSGDIVRQDKQKAKRFLRIASRKGDPMAEAILYSMENEAVRNAMIERARTFKARMAEMYERAQRQAAYTRSAYTPSLSSSSSSSRAMAASMRRYQARVDQTNWNNRMNYLTGRSSACPSSNPYC